jgi:hypothetical protein
LGGVALAWVVADAVAIAFSGGSIGFARSGFGVGELGVAERGGNELVIEGALDFSEGVGVTAFATYARIRLAKAICRVFMGGFLSWGF